MRPMVLLLALLLAAVALPAAVPAAPAAAAAYTPNGCPIGVPAGMQIDCGTLTVPENRTTPDGRQIQLAVAIIRAPGPNPAPDPLVYLSGGPGSPAISTAIGIWRAYQPFLGNRDMVVLDQRGTGFSQPALHCPEVGQFNDAVFAQNLSRPARVAAELDALLACGQRWRAAGVDLGAYTSAASAADLEELRLALGYGQWNVLGLSYGTRLALTLLRDYPTSLRSVILDSTYPLQAGLYTELPANIARSLHILSTNCNADPACASRYPNVESVLYDAAAYLDANPATVTIRHPRTGAPVTYTVDGGSLMEELFRMIYRTRSIGALPPFIYDVARGNYPRLAQQNANRKLGNGGGVAHATYFAVQCNEEIGFTSMDDVRAVLDERPAMRTFAAGLMELTEHIYTLCAAWGASPPDLRENQPVISDVPTLLLAGEYDAITPATWATQAAETLSRGYVYTFPGQGHAVSFSGPCATSIARAFLDNPAAAPDASCLR